VGGEPITVDQPLNPIVDGETEVLVAGKYDTILKLFQSGINQFRKLIRRPRTAPKKTPATSPKRPSQPSLGQVQLTPA
jgi:hypothetical protein